MEYEKILGECHDGQDYKLLMEDGSIKIVAKSEVDEVDKPKRGRPKKKEDEENEDE